MSAPEDAIDVVLSLVSGMTRDELLGSAKRGGRFTRARSVCSWLCRRHLGLGLLETARALRLDHSSVFKGVERVEEHLQAHREPWSSLANQCAHELRRRVEHAIGPRRAAGALLRIYVTAAPSNPARPAVVSYLRELGVAVYDASDLDSGGRTWGARQAVLGWPRGPVEYRRQLLEPLATRCYSQDIGALRAADACLMIHPADTSSALELGWAAGGGKPSAALLPGGLEWDPHENSPAPLGSAQLTGSDLMLRVAASILIGREELRAWVRRLDQEVS